MPLPLRSLTSVDTSKPPWNEVDSTRCGWFAMLFHLPPIVPPSASVPSKRSCGSPFELRSADVKNCSGCPPGPVPPVGTGCGEPPLEATAGCPCDHGGVPLIDVKYCAICDSAPKNVDMN